MQRHKGLNLPTEIMRSIIVIAETGSITRTAALLGLSQPAVSAQIKRIESMVGGAIFEKTPNGSAATELGKMVIKQARKILEANDQLLVLHSPAAERQAMRVGVTSLNVGRVLACLAKAGRASTSVYADGSAEIEKGLASGFVDVALPHRAPDAAPDASYETLLERERPAVWVRSRDFVLSPGAPIPLITWPGQISHGLMTDALERAGMAYRLAFTSPDAHAALQATVAGVGLLALVDGSVPSSLVVATDYYLPPLRAPRFVLAVRPGAQLKDPDLVDCLAKEFFGETLS